MKNYYEILEVSQNASDEVIKKVYKVLSKKYHPDLQPPEKKQEAEEKFKLINEAYETLSNIEKRKEYDQSLKPRQVSFEQYEFVKKQNDLLRSKLELLTNERDVNNYSNNFVKDFSNEDYEPETYEEPVYEAEEKIPFKVKLKAYAKYYFKLFIYRFKQPIALFLSVLVLAFLYKVGFFKFLFNLNNVGIK